MEARLGAAPASGPGDAAPPLVLHPPMVDDQSAEQAAFYRANAEAYDTLIAAEDADFTLLRALAEVTRLEGATVVDVGAGTGRFARMLIGRAAHVHLVEREPAMLDVARRALDGRDDVTFHLADARAIPLAEASVDLAVAGWVFGHFPHWMPASWQAEVDAAIAEMRRVVRPGGAVVIVETLGTGHTEPRSHAVLDVYFSHLEARHGLARRWLRTDYEFPDAETAAAVCTPFFGEELGARIRREGWARVPECTAMFSATVAG